MLIVTKDAGHEKISVGNNEVVLTGPPSDLRGYVKMTNNNDDVAKVKALPVTQPANAAGGSSSQLRLSCKLLPGEEKMQSVLHRLPQHTAPGTYESTIVAGGQERKLKLIVQGVIDINVHPLDFTFMDTTPGKVHTASFTVTNLGNMPFQVPEVKHVTTLDMDFLCRAVSLGFREKGMTSYMDTMDQITKHIADDMADWVNVSLKESGKIIAPGDTMVMTLELTLPKDVNPKKDYLGTIRFWDRTLNYSIKAHSSK